MREIKFRYWCTFEKKMYDKAYVEEHLELAFMSELLDVAQNRYIFQQYTGLKDRNGTEIFEGDILTVWIGGYKQDTPEIVESLEELYLNFNRDDSYYRFGVCEVIGNKFENPTLLEVQP